MKLDIRRIQEKLDELVRYHDELVEDLPSQREFVHDRLTRRGIEKTLELMADTVLDISLMIISEKSLGKPEDSRAAIRVLEQKKILSSKVSAQIQNFISLRNLIVHRYGKIDEEMEFESVTENHNDILLFVKEIERFLKR